MFRDRYSALVIDLSPNVFKEAYVINAIINDQRVAVKPDHLDVAYMSRESTGPVDPKPLPYEETGHYPKMPFFIPSDINYGFDSKLLEKSGLVSEEFKEELSNSKNYQKNKESITAHLSTLGAGQLTLLGFMCEGSQGLVTGNNSRYVGVLPVDNGEKLAIWKQFNKAVARYIKHYLQHTLHAAQGSSTRRQKKSRPNKGLQPLERG